MTRTQWALLTILLLGYAGLSHYSSYAPGAKGLAAGLSIGPVLVVGLVLLWRWWGTTLAILSAVLASAALVRYWGSIEQHYAWADLMEQCGAYLLVASSFARSSLGGRVPLCTQLAVRIHGELTPPEIRYTRHATTAWAVFYLALAAVIAVLFFVVTERAWSLFVNFVTFGLIALACLIDAALRHRLLPHRADSGLMTLLRQALLG